MRTVTYGARRQGSALIVAGPDLSGDTVSRKVLCKSAGMARAVEQHVRAISTELGGLTLEPLVSLAVDAALIEHPDGDRRGLPAVWWAEAARDAEARGRDAGLFWARAAVRMLGALAT